VINPGGDAAAGAEEAAAATSGDEESAGATALEQAVQHQEARIHVRHLSITPFGTPRYARRYLEKCVISFSLE